MVFIQVSKYSDCRNIEHQEVKCLAQGPNGGNIEYIAKKLKNILGLANQFL